MNDVTVRPVPSDILLLGYSEWLDQQGLIVGDRVPGADQRSHEQLVDDFLASVAA